MSGRWQPGGPRLDPTSLRALLQIFREQAGLEFPQDTEFVIERRLQERLEALGLEGFDEYVRLLRSPQGQRELELALDEVTTHETYFFREEFQLNAFRHEVLPRLRALTEGRKRMTIWSAGCSSGEEVYTIAMLIDASRLLEGWTVRVVGSDLSRRCLATARSGVYGRSSFRAVPRDYLTRYFHDEGGKMRVVDEIRSQCLFLQENLLDRERHITLGRVEAIFCRNVLIYLEAEARQKVLGTLYERLCPGGYLLLGHSESLLHDGDSPFEIVHLSGDVVYRRPEREDGRRPLDPGRTR